MNILAFDTSTEKFSICILKNNKVVLNLSKILYKTYSNFLIPILKKSLSDLRIATHSAEDDEIPFPIGMSLWIRIFK